MVDEGEHVLNNQAFADVLERCRTLLEANVDDIGTSNCCRLRPQQGSDKDAESALIRHPTDDARRGENFQDSGEENTRLPRSHLDACHPIGKAE